MAVSISGSDALLFVDGQLIANVQLPLPGKLQGKVINDAENVGVPFVIGGFRHSQDPPFHLEYGSFEGEIDEVRISSIMRYPVAEHLTILRQELPVADLQAHYSVQLSADAAQGDVHWELAEGQLPEGLTLDGVSGLLHGTPSAAIDQQSFALRAMDSGGEVDENAFHLSVQPGRISTESLPPAFAGVEYVTAMKAEHMAEPVRWTLLSGALPEGMHLESGTGELTGLPTSPGVATFRVEAVDAGGLNYQTDLTLKVLPATLHVIGPDEQTVVLYDWQGSNGQLIRDIVGDEELTLTWTNMGGDRRVSWPGREGRFPQDTGHGEHGFVGPQHSDKLDLRTCMAEWTVEAWVRRGGPFQAFGDKLDKHNQPFDYGHICGTYDNTERGVWELYLCDHNSPDGTMAPGAHFLGTDPARALMDLHPWKRPQGIVGSVADSGIGDTEWHHVAWQYSYADDAHQLFLDGKLVWKMASPDGLKLVNDRQHDAQFSVMCRLNGYARYGGDINWLGFGNFFGQVGEIRISNVRRYQ